MDAWEAFWRFSKVSVVNPFTMIVIPASRNTELGVTRLYDRNKYPRLGKHGH